MYTTTITQKGQVTIPVHIRKRWGIKKNEKVVFIERHNVVQIKRAVDFFSLKGSVKRKKTYTDRKADQVIADYVAQEHEKKNSRS